MKSKGAFEPHGNHGVAKNSFFNSNHNSSSSISSIDRDELDHHHLLYFDHQHHSHNFHHHQHHRQQHNDRHATKTENQKFCWFQPNFKQFIPFIGKHQQQRVHHPVFIFIAWCLVLAITSTSLIDCVNAGAGGDVATKTAFGSAALPVLNLGPEITTEFGE